MLNTVQKFQEFFIRYFYHPFQLRKPVNFRDTIQNVQHILVYCPEEAMIKSINQNLKKLFRNARIHYILPFEKSNNIHRITKAEHIHYLYKDSIYKSQRSEHYANLLRQPVDLFIDLDIEPNILNIFLCRLLQPAVCLSYHKPLSRHYYNFEYRSRSYSPAPERFQCLYTILSSWTAG